MRHLLATATALLAASMLFGAWNGPSAAETRDRFGGTVRLRDAGAERPVYFIFTADSMFEGGPYVLDVLRERGVKGSFFFTGNFLRDSVRNGDIVRRAIAEGHYVGGHGDRHILLADWDNARTPLATADSAVADMQANYLWLNRFGVDTVKARFVVPPYEWYAACHTEAYRKAGYVPVTPSPHLLTYRDYTTPDMTDYYGSDTITADFMHNLRTRDLAGQFIIVHAGTQDSRTDKFYRRLPQLLDSLDRYGYTPQRL